MKRIAPDTTGPSVCYLLVGSDTGDTTPREPPSYHGVYRTKQSAQEALQRQKVIEIEIFLNEIFFNNERISSSLPPHDSEYFVDNADQGEYAYMSRFIKFCTKYTDWVLADTTFGYERYRYRFKPECSSNQAILDKAFRKVYEIVDDENFEITLTIEELPLYV